MDFQTWIDSIDGLAGIYAFDILPDGSYSEIRLMAVNQQNAGLLHMRPDAPAFYPGIPYRNYWMDVNFEDFVYRCASTNQPLYSYVNAHGYWLKGFYLPVTEPGTVSAAVNAASADKTPRTVYCLYLVGYSQQVESDSMSQKSSEISAAIMHISVKLHETQDFYKAMAAASAELKKISGAERCSLYIVDKNSQKCEFISPDGSQKEMLAELASEMGRSPFEIATAWEEDLALSDCLLLEDLHLVEERDPVWFASLQKHGIRNIILYAVRYNQMLVGFIWAANFEADKTMQIKETFELTTFLLAAVIANHQLVARLEFRSSVDGLTQVSNRNAMNERVDQFISGEVPLPAVMGVAFADLNGLKTVNDDDGHDAGDRLLSRAAALLKLAFGNYEIYRAGGDEFVILCPDITEAQLAAQVEQLRALADNTADVSFAVGTAYCTGSYNICHAMQQADEQMYKDKEAYYRQHPEKDRRRRSRG